MSCDYYKNDDTISDSGNCAVHLVYGRKYLLRTRTFLPSKCSTGYISGFTCSHSDVQNEICTFSETPQNIYFSLQDASGKKDTGDLVEKTDGVLFLAWKYEDTNEPWSFLGYMTAVWHDTDLIPTINPKRDTSGDQVWNLAPYGDDLYVNSRFLLSNSLTDKTPNNICLFTGDCNLTCYESEFPTYYPAYFMLEDIQNQSSNSWIYELKNKEGGKCTTDSDCVSGKTTCVNGVCRVGCKTDKDCNTTYSNNFMYCAGSDAGKKYCIPLQGCRVRDDCVVSSNDTNDFTCRDKLCYPPSSGPSPPGGTCNTDKDCPSGQVCDQDTGKCIDDNYHPNSNKTVTVIIIIVSALIVAAILGLVFWEIKHTLEES